MADDKAEDIAPPFRGFIATTYDALLVFEAARRGMIPRVTRRLNDSERSMVQSGSVFVYDEQESGIKRWTDGHSWSPSRILANFLVYRETIKPAESKDGKDGDNAKKEGGSRPGSSHGTRPATAHSTPGHASPADGYGAESSRMAMEANSRRPPTLAHGQMRPRSAAEAGGCRLENGIVIDRHLERKLVGSLTNSYLFHPGGLVKKTMTLPINGFHQHVVSYYTLEDAVAGRLRRPSTIPEFTALDISPEYLNLANFRYPPSIDMGSDGVPRYHGEQDDRPVSPARMPTAYADMYGDPYGQPTTFDSHHGPRIRAITAPTVSAGFSPTVPSPGYPVPPPSAGYYDPPPMHPMAAAPRPSGPIRPSTAQSAHRYDPYGGNPRAGGQGDGAHARRLSQPPPNSNSDPGYYQHSDYNYQPPSTAPGAFPYYSAAAAPPPSQAPMPSPMMSPGYPSSQYTGWHQPPAAMRLMPPSRSDMLHGAGDPPSSAGSIDSAPGSSGAHMVPPSDGWAPVPSNAPPAWDNHPQQMAQPYAVTQNDGWQAGLA
ncbi:hypothetical protein CC85DRAFT_303862 [Cutaneotrichosporon oleaginosum]|uniref:Gti1/Pac2 family-domain-containing protein n=1 Tax=Cutaneotrichosporon oleaginosum TaxID=879819 RepID=A0A0J1AZH6_9TREE|nr:uncharacterized protein CC85DRAFT_303862 [Cutaneotrichosporon oleaginosum]KLT40744.1 hypothetical protein CC85DRAFT_303862 [Cutaneotrichosporon oleaginosum]TXT06800.1 hypothetical protein COLE_06131 [Cutaneotrichosporon oleaginosum]